MIIRRVEKKDREQLITLLDEFDKETDTFLAPEVTSFAEYKDTYVTLLDAANMYISDSHYIVFVAEENHRLLGYISGEIIEKKQRKMDTEGYIKDWFVTKSARHRKVGNNSFKALVEEFEKKGCTHLSLQVRVGNTYAREIYKKMGFKETSIILVRNIK